MVPQDTDRHLSIIEHAAAKIQQSSLATDILQAAHLASIPLSAIDRIDENRSTASETWAAFKR
jgi:hypothetical protein